MFKFLVGKQGAGPCGWGHHASVSAAPSADNQSDRVDEVRLCSEEPRPAEVGERQAPGAICSAK